MITHGDTEVVNLRTGEQQRRVTGNGESRLESLAHQAWLEYVEKRERETVWRHDRSGTPGNRAIDESCFIEGFKQGVIHALSQRS